MSDAASRPTVLAVVVATNGAATLPRTLASLQSQTYGDLVVVGVDNGSSDASRDLLVEFLGQRHVLVAERDLGFGGAVGMALDAEVARGPALVLLVHDDLALADDAVERLVETIQRDDELAIVGCKLVEWEDARRLQAVGMSVDVTGRADPGVEPDEVDQGQRDHEGPTLYVSTAGMLLRRDRFEQLGRFDHRYHLFRDDLDLCWRAWLAGWRVEVVPEAVASHEASASTYRRLGQTATLGPRYFAERNTLATLLKNYGLGRLLYVLPLFFAVGIAKVVGFVMTRRLGDGWQTLRAWAWNILHLRETRRLRRRVQEGRVRGDRELQGMFAQVSERVRAYGEALGELISGGSDDLGLDDPDAPLVPALTMGERARLTLRTSPVGVAGLVLLVLGAVVSIPLLGRTPLLGGELATWPEGMLSLVRGYVEPWTVGDLPAVDRVSPAQLLLAIPAVLTGGVTWAAPRLLLLSVVPVAWIAGLRAGRLVTDRRLPRVAGATLYALSPPMLAALRTGRVGSALAAALAPLLVVAAARAVMAGVPLDRAWRAVAATALLGAAVVALAPETVILVVLAAVVAGAGIALGAPLDVRGRSIRLVAAVVGAGVLLLPWWPSFSVLDGLSQTSSDTALASLLLLAPPLPGFPSPLAGAGLAAAVLLGLAFAADRRGPAAGLAGTYLAAVGVAWYAVRLGVDASVWPGAPLTVAALAAAGLLAIAFSTVEDELTEHAFGWRQLATVAGAVLVSVGVIASSLSIASTAWDGYSEAPSPLPAFLATQVETDGVGEFRVLVLEDADAGVSWSITDADGPTLASYGHRLAHDVRATLAAHIGTVVSGSDAGAATDLGRLGVRYLVVPESGRSERLDAALAAQLDLVAEPVASGLVLRVTTWLPRWSVLPADAGPMIADGRPLPAGAAATSLEDRASGTPGLLVLADPVDTETPGWVVTADGLEIEPQVLGDVLAWELHGDEITVEPIGRRQHVWLVALQGVLIALALSLSLRAPRFARRVGV